MSIGKMLKEFFERIFRCNFIAKWFLQRQIKEKSKYMNFLLAAFPPDHNHHPLITEMLNDLHVGIQNDGDKLHNL